MREGCKPDGTLGERAPYVESPTGATLQTEQREIRAVELRRYDHFVGRPCRALSLLMKATQGLVAPTGLRTLGSRGIAPIGA